MTTITYPCQTCGQPMGRTVIDGHVVLFGCDVCQWRRQEVTICLCPSCCAILVQSTPTVWQYGAGDTFGVPGGG